MFDDGYWLPGALALYVAAAVVAVLRASRPPAEQTPTMLLLALALLVHAVAIGVRWERLGHGPYVDLFEILSSNVWSLHLVVFATTVIWPRLRGGVAPALVVLSVLVIWMLAAPMRDTVAPVTYDTIWLPIHMVLGKLFLGLTGAYDTVVHERSTFGDPYATYLAQRQAVPVARFAAAGGGVEAIED